jgi:hypothetical protein
MTGDRDCSLIVTTRELAASRPLLSWLPSARGALSWVKGDEGLVGWGQPTSSLLIAPPGSSQLDLVSRVHPPEPLSPAT